MINMTSTTHPYFDGKVPDWLKWRLTYEGGKRFIDEYLQQFTGRETAADFLVRKSLTYCPAFAKSAIDDVKNSIYQRMCDIVRVGATPSYESATVGKLGGVDLKGSTMNSFIGCEVLPELLTMERVGIYIDMPVLHSNNLKEVGDKHPYLYVYRAEQIKTWIQSSDGTYQSVVLEDSNYEVDEDTGFPTGNETKYRYIRKENGRVIVTFYSQGDNGEAEEGETVDLNLTEIPFVCVEINNSLLTDIADYQIALLNLASSDMNYAMKANYPFYVEQYSPQADMALLALKNNAPEDSNVPTTKDIHVGVAQGRRYPQGLDAPSFIHPSPEPLKISMEKQDQLKKEIRQILNLNISNITVPRASAESKRMDSAGLESGLSYIGLALEIAENRIAKIWAGYEGQSIEPAVKYPQKYELKSDDDRRTEAKELAELVEVVPSKTYQKEVTKRIADVMLGGTVQLETMNKINEEVNSADVVTSKPKDLLADVENGLVSKEKASEIRGYPKGEAEKAKNEHVERLAAIAEHQAKAKGAGDNPAARGNADGAADPGPAARAEKIVNKDSQDTVTDNTRGEGK